MDRFIKLHYWEYLVLFLGYGGYAQKKWTVPKKGQGLVEEYPEFYEKLKELKISVVPENQGGYIQKKVQIFNNSVGYASDEQGGNLIVKEQWLENPIWDIYIMLDCEEAEKIASALENKQCIFYSIFRKKRSSGRYK